MVFSSTVFIFFFLPITLAGYFLFRPIKWKNIWLLMASLFFYFWGGYAFFPIILYSILLNYVGGRMLEAPRLSEQKRFRKGIFILILILNLLSLGYWKYAKFIMQTFRSLTGLRFSIPDIILPIGISFFTFQGMSYIIDVYRKEVPVQKNLLNLGLYIALFPQLIAGPIVRYSDIEKQLSQRVHSVDNFSLGIRIFTIGLAKKAIIANSAAITADAIFDIPPFQNEPSVAWLGIVFYSLQLYFDFSGYSDMAIGIGKMFGFQFPRNFNYPYISCSASDLWRRWHISLSVWFRDYVYIPLGGSRKGNVYLHLLCVFILTGVWHGATWNTVLWGLYWGIIVVAEKLILKNIKCPIKIPKIISWMLTIFLWLLSMPIFRTDTLLECLQYFQSMFGFTPHENIGFSLSYYIHSYELFIIITGIIAMTPLGKYCYLWLKEKISENVFLVIENTVAILLLGISILYVVTGTYNPFIYFQF
ncbi:MAG: MBOAT family protein [Lachnospiraceae bacterium]|nr:MBOAT family protein [Lachnospiraceae bacterium]